ncbi:MAG: radical SAM protein [Pseudomonadota bacterium]
MDPRVETWINAIRGEYGEHFSSLRWASEEVVAAAGAERADLLAWFAVHGTVACAGTKPHVGPLAPGCQRCAAGTWSCLFVNGRCNGACFFCPTPQVEVGQPETSTVPFPKVKDYLAYVARMGIRGVGLSGGEPLLTADRTAGLCAALKARFGADLHVWMYTNGLLLEEGILARLRDAGLDEIRIDACANGYDLAPLRLARAAIPTLTVEIPAVPEHEARLRGLLPRWRDLGLDFLNLHQLRLTPHNREHLVARGYTFLPGPRVTVLESELCALRLARHSLEAGIGLPVNYCSSPYKQRFQALAARRRLGVFVRHPGEEPTEAGYLRALALKGAPERVAALARQLGERPELAGDWAWSRGADRLVLTAAALATVDREGLELVVGYVEPQLQPQVSYRYPFQPIQLETGRVLYGERRPVARDLPTTAATPGAEHQDWESVEEGLIPYTRPASWCSQGL